MGDGPPPPLPHDAHVQDAHKAFRDCGFSIDAMQYRRPAEALAAFRRHHRVPDGWKHPFAWNYFPNEWCRDNWRSMYGD